MNANEFVTGGVSLKGEKDGKDPNPSFYHLSRVSANHCFMFSAFPPETVSEIIGFFRLLPGAATMHGALENVNRDGSLSSKTSEELMPILDEALLRRAFIYSTFGETFYEQPDSCVPKYVNTQKDFDASDLHKTLLNTILNVLVNEGKTSVCCCIWSPCLAFVLV